MLWQELQSLMGAGPDAHCVTEQHKNTKKRCRNGAMPAAAPLLQQALSSATAGGGGACVRPLAVVLSIMVRPQPAYV